MSVKKAKNSLAGSVELLYMQLPPSVREGIPRKGSAKLQHVILYVAYLEGVNAMLEKDSGRSVLISDVPVLLTIQEKSKSGLGEGAIISLKHTEVEIKISTCEELLTRLKGMLVRALTPAYDLTALSVLRPVKRRQSFVEECLENKPTSQKKVLIANAKNVPEEVRATTAKLVPMPSILQRFRPIASKENMREHFKKTYRLPSYLSQKKVLRNVVTVVHLSLVRPEADANTVNIPSAGSPAAKTAAEFAVETLRTPSKSQVFIRDLFLSTAQDLALSPRCFTPKRRVVHQPEVVLSPLLSGVSLEDECRTPLRIL